MKALAYIAVRRSVGGPEWFDVDSLSGGRECCEQKARAIEPQIPAWAAANPIVRIAVVDVSEKL